ncbi:ATP-binding protein [Eubacteriaceae bacterium ES3]|nr:ATP-binding protein [Eubacteriaceae bacterium ES3]
MKELSLHLLDITQNSVRAQASLIKLTINEAVKKNLLSMEIEDNGKGIPSDRLAVITDPFVTSRTTRRVGLGLSMFEAAAKQCGGEFEIQSREGLGTTVSASFIYDHIDRVPLGNMADTIVTMVMSFGAADLLYQHIYNENIFVFDTREIRAALEVVSLNEIEILEWIRENVAEGLEEIMEG